MCLIRAGSWPNCSVSEDLRKGGQRTQTSTTYCRMLRNKDPALNHSSTLLYTVLRLKIFVLAAMPHHYRQRLHILVYHVIVGIRVQYGRCDWIDFMAWNNCIFDVKNNQPVVSHELIIKFDYVS